MGVHNQAEAHEPLGQLNEKHPNLGVYTSIYTIQEIDTPQNHDSVSSPHENIIIIVKIHVSVSI